MKKQTAVTTTAHPRQNRVLIALAAAWLILSLAIGGMVNANDSADEAANPPVTSAVTRH